MGEPWPTSKQTFPRHSWLKASWISWQDALARISSGWYPCRYCYVHRLLSTFYGQKENDTFRLYDLYFHRAFAHKYYFSPIHKWKAQHSERFRNVAKTTLVGSADKGFWLKSACPQDPSVFHSTAGPPLITTTQAISTNNIFMFVIYWIAINCPVNLFQCSF